MVNGRIVQMPPSTPTSLSREARRHRETGLFDDVKVAVAYYSQRGHVARLAAAVAEGAQRIQDIQVSTWSVVTLTPELWKALDAADALVFGAPTYMGGPAAAFKAFADASLSAWLDDLRWRHKIAAGFTHSQAMSGDKLNTLQYFSILAAQHGMLWVTLDLYPGWCTSSGRITDRNRLGGWLGVMSQSNGDGPTEENPGIGDLETACYLGERVARVASELVAGRRAISSVIE